MYKTIAVLAMIGGVFLNGPLCCCGMSIPQTAAKSSACGHCHQKSQEPAGDSSSNPHPGRNSSSSLPNQGCKDCGCPHGIQAIKAATDTFDVGGISATTLWAAPVTEFSVSPQEAFRTLAQAVRGPPGDLSVPLFILHLHLAI